MKNQLSEDAIVQLMDAKDYRDFICRWIAIQSSVKKLSYADIARVGGFSARSFPREVLTGTKRLTLYSSSKMAKGLRLPSDLAGYLKILIELSHEDCRIEAISEQELLRIRDRQKERILRKVGRGGIKNDCAFEVSTIPEVYAALGEPGIGATINEIINRTQLPVAAIEDSLNRMQVAGIISKQSGRYRVKQSHLNIEGLSESEIFKKHFRSVAERSAKMMKYDQSSDSKLFLSSAFSVQKRDLPILKNELRNLLLKFVDRSERPSGDKVVNIIASLF